MRTATVAESRLADLRLLEVSLPGRAPEPCGVILFDGATGRIGIRMRRDWDALTGNGDDLDVFEALEEDLRAKAGELGAAALMAQLEDTLSNTIRMSQPERVLLGPFNATLNRMYERHVPATVRRYDTHLPVWSVRAAAGGFGGRMTAELEDWIEVPAGVRITTGMFAAHVLGRSMEPRIASGSLCLFREFGAGSRQGKLVLVEDLSEPEGGERYTVKRYRSAKRASEDGEWEHAEIWMEPLNPEFDRWQLTEDKPARVVAEFVAVLD